MYNKEKDREVSPRNHTKQKNQPIVHITENFISRAVSDTDDGWRGGPLVHDGGEPPAACSNIALCNRGLCLLPCP